jgi:gliding motility-associated-like protein
MRIVYISLITILFPIIVYPQLTVLNPGLEGTPGSLFITPAPWDNCMPFGTFVAGVGDAATPDTQPGCYGVTLPPSEGVSYIGFGHIPNYNIVNPYLGVDEWQEGFSQELSSPMIANGCPYEFTIDLANGLTPDPWNSTGIQTTIGEVRVYGGFDFCSEEELLWSSGPVTNEQWQTYNVEFIPNTNYTHISFQCVKTEKNAICAYLLADNITPIVNSPPFSDAGANIEICNNSIYLNANNLESGQTGSWSIISGNGNFIDINDPNTLVTNLEEGNNIFEWSVIAECSEEIGISEVNIFVYEEPEPNAGINQEICENFTYLNGNTLSDEEIGVWSIISGNGNFNDINDPNTLVTNLNVGINIFEWSISSTLCSEISDEVAINYVISNLASNAGNDQELCDTEALLNANIPGENENGIWNIISGTGVFFDDTDPNTLITNLSVGENILEWIISDPCESSASQINITVQELNVSIENVSNYNNYNITCSGLEDGFIELVPIGGYPPYLYSWVGPNNFISNNQNIYNLPSGLYECNILDNNGCEQFISIILNEPEPLDIEFIGSENLDCFNNPFINFNLINGIGSVEGIINTSWGETTNFIWNNTNQWYFEYNNFDQWNGTINVSATDANGCEANSETITVETWEDPFADFEMSSTDTIIFEPIEFIDYSTSDSPIINWFWDFGDGNVSNLENPIHLYENEGQYNICLTIQDENGCESKKCNIINIYENSYAYIPDIFTVNNDNINENFLPIIRGVLEDSYLMLIYDRWGKLLFSTTNHMKGWDGTHNGNIVTEDVYSYKISYITQSGKEKKYIGKVTLVK